ncbi:LacI family DNA-binding transcriptional regulator [Glaciihabitans sp. dw_435]|uniref:LacI family DNA-binding transcriptional regulator n=1 Tax=Glaciihabitans sp. dw_435 TaxID=2720081 RepID=UPI001BD37B96|nr:LacI family DNA-binding transcriptional regulator [Glaciihabitans sp. dw_435]
MKPEASDSHARPNLAAVAALAGVSGSTASLAFSGAGPVSAATRAKVLAAAETLGYAGPDPRAQSLRRGRSGVVGVVIEDRLSDAFRDPINIAMLDGIADVAGAAGAGLLLLTETGDNRATIASAPMDAVILVGCSTRLNETVATLRQRGMPIVAIEADDIPGVLAIGLDNRPASALAARYLRELGHERVAVVTLPLDPQHTSGPIPAEWEATATSYTAIERLRGVTDVFPGVGGYIASGSSIEAGRRAGFALLQHPSARPTAIIAQSDLLALGVIRAAEELGIAVPHDLSVIGFDGVRLDGLEPYELTTLVQPAVDKGRAAGEAVMRLLEGEDVEPVNFSSVFHVGNTTAPATP